MSGAARDWLADAQASSRQIAADAGLLGVPEVECRNQCGRWVRLGSGAPCNHEDPVCADCYPNGCPECEWQEHETLAHREEAANRIRHAAHEIRVAADDLSDTDLRELGWMDRKDVLRHVEETVETLLRVRDILRPRTTP